MFNVSGETSSFCNIPKAENVLNYRAKIILEIA